MWLRAVFINKLGGWSIVVYWFGLVVVLTLLFLLAQPAMQSIFLTDYVQSYENPITLDHPTYSTGALIAGCFFILLFGGSFTVTVGIAVAVWLSEFVGRGLQSSISKVLQLFAAVPPIVYGYLWLMFFNQVETKEALANGLTGGFTLGLMMLPIFLFETHKVLQSIPFNLRQGAYSLGATRYQTAFFLLVPAYLTPIFVITLLTLARTLAEILLLALVVGILKMRVWTLILIFLIVILLNVVGFLLTEPEKVEPKKEIEKI